MSMLLGIDIGSSGVKAALVDPEAGVLAAAQEPVELYSPRAGWAEADPGEWWDAVCSLVPRLLAAGGRGAREIDGVATSGMVPAVLALDESGRPLRRAILQNDARATAEVTELSRLLTDIDLLGLTGSSLTQQSVAPTLRWLERHEPDVFGGTATVAGSYDWVARMLGAEPHVERNWAIESGLFDLEDRVLGPVLERAAISPGLLPPVRSPGTPVGEVSAAAAEASGLHAGAGDILVVSDGPLVDARLYLDAHPAGTWLPNGCMATSGSLVRWLARVSGGAPLETLDAEAAATPPGAGGIVCLPYFLGEKSPLHDPAQRGAFVGLHLGHERGHLHRAALEAVAYGFRHHVEVFAERGIALGAARVTNGGSSSLLWKQILADVLDVALVPVLDHPGASLGAALAAGVGTGRSGWDAIRPLVRLGDPIEPRPEFRQRYDELYAIYRELEPALRPISHRLAAEEWS